MDKTSTEKRKERKLWVILSTVLSGIMILLVFIPTVAPQPRETDSDELLDVFEQIFHFVENNYIDQVDPEELLEGALIGLFESLNDPYSAYLIEEEMRNLNDKALSGEFGGVGLYISKQLQNGEETGPVFVEVVSPIEGTPAYKAGITGGDLIISIEGDSTEDLSLHEVVSRLRGKPGTKVTVTIQRNKTIVFDVDIERAMIQIPTVKFDVLPDKIAYLRIIQFTPFTAADIQEAIQSFDAANYVSLVIDLRSNPGGLLSSAVDVADLFFESGTIVSTRSRVLNMNTVYSASSGAKVPEDKPIVILIDGGSASASEILAGVFKDNKRASLIGETTYGKGSVQQVHPLGKTGFRLTMSRYYTPSGVSIEQVGIEPDLLVEEPELSEEEIESYSKLIAENTIVNFVEEYEDPNYEQIDRFILELRDDGLLLEDRIIKRLIRNQVVRTSPSPPVYDLEYDIVLSEAVKYLQENTQ
jgi:carboxyl-terminal processing protease